MPYKPPPRKPKFAEWYPNPEAVELARALRNPRCTLCPLHANNPGNACQWGDGPTEIGTNMVVYEQPGYWDNVRRQPLIGQPGAYFNAVLDMANLSRADLYVTSMLKCSPNDATDTPAIKAVAQQQCGCYLTAEIEAIQPRVILAMGASPYYHFTHKAVGVTKARGDAQIWPHANNPMVVVTISPAQVLRSPALAEPFTADVKKFARYVRGADEQPRVEIVEIHTPAELNAALAELWEERDKPLTFDLETRGFVAHQPAYSKVWCAAFTRGGLNPELNAMRAFLIPLEHPDSPFAAEGIRCHPAVVREVLRLVQCNRVSGHNVLFDMLHSRYLAQRYDLDMASLNPEWEAIPEDADAWSKSNPRPLPEPARTPLERTRKPAGSRRKGGPAAAGAGSGSEPDAVRPDHPEAAQPGGDGAGSGTRPAPDLGLPEPGELRSGAAGEPEPGSAAHGDPGGAERRDAAGGASAGGTGRHRDGKRQRDSDPDRAASPKPARRTPRRRAADAGVAAGGGSADRPTEQLPPALGADAG